ncbi:hypothetical protein [Breznakiella homolactica]|uniref:Uncharacterized protein n=1 Tax=Breznakiella homolactica TaxID=2798577 RepID=A0A7T7XL91_9SPIR|nr:hypothetical protein [Breznakiella homolactica]QQO08318.1 hypothetical protein JFL75_15475 [Breznakiella homolactica]
MELVLFIGGGFLSLAVFAGLIYFVVSKKSTTAVRVASIVALVLILASVGVSLFLIFSVPAGKAGAAGSVVSDFPVEAAGGDLKNVIIFLGILFIIFSLIVYVALRDRKLQMKKAASMKDRKHPSERD